MDDIVERFLETKLESELKEAQAAAAASGPSLKTNCTKLNSILLDCQELKDKVKAKKGTGRDKLYNLLNVITEWHELSAKTNCPAAKCSLDKISNYLKQLKKDLAEETTATEQGKPTKPEIYRWSGHAESLAAIHGFDDRLKIMQRLLLKPAPKPIGIVGVAGVGKTALCQLAYNHPPVKDRFPLRLWLCLSKNKDAVRDHKDYLKMMMSCLGYEDQVIQKIGGDERRLQVALQRHLGRGRYLVVLDDVWIDKEADKFVMDGEILKLFGFLNRPLGTLVVTCRSPELEEVLGADSIDVHKLLPLADRDSCLSIFNDACKQEIKLSKDEENGIVEKCGGLPLMAKMLGEIGPPPVKETASKLNENSTPTNNNQ